jgi:hypothetical protein
MMEKKIFFYCLALISLVLLSGFILNFALENQFLLEKKLNLSEKDSTYSQSIQQHWISINPVNNSNSSNRLMQAHFSLINVTGTTNFSCESYLQIKILTDEKTRSIPISDPFFPVICTNGTNEFSYTYDMQNEPSGRYLVEISPVSRTDNKSFAFSFFDYTSNVSRKSIDINPILWTYPDQLLAITGTTDLPVDSNMSIISGLMIHPCPTQKIPETNNGIRSWCGGNCGDDITTYPVKIVSSSNGSNSWRSLINTTGWCTREYYWIRVLSEKNNHTISLASEEFQYLG